MGTVYFELSMSLDGLITGPGVSVAQPLGEGGERLHDWMFEGRTDDESREFGESVFAPAGAVVMGRTMLDLGIEPWGDNPTFHVPSSWSPIDRTTRSPRRAAPRTTS